MLTKVFGIISYLPDNQIIRKARFEKLSRLIDTCNQLFNLPIYIVIQNYNSTEIDILNNKKVKLSENYTPCGILGARRKLREWFIQSPYDCIIMLDDDCVIIGDKHGAAEYVRQIDSHPDCFGEFKGSQLKLFSICKYLIEQVDYDDINPENGDGFEDTIFVNKLRSYFPNKKFTFRAIGNLHETSVGAKDELSTWYKDQDLKTMLEKTHKICDELKNG